MLISGKRSIPDMKTGLVVEGGGMKCAYSAGILDRFLDEHITFDYCIGVSAGSANTASYLAGQRGRNLRFYVDHLNEPGYMGVKNLLRTGQFFGLQYIYQTLTNSDGADPIDYPAIVENPAEFEEWRWGKEHVTTHPFIVDMEVLQETLRKLEGKPVYFTKDDMKQDDYRAIMASCALPIMCRPISFHNETYFDGGLSDSVPIERAFAKGCDRVVVILSKPRSFVKQPEGFRHIYRHALRKYPQTIKALDNRHLMYRQNIADVKKHETAGEALVFAPSKELKMSTYARDEKLEQELYDLGISDFNARLKELHTFLS